MAGKHSRGFHGVCHALAPGALVLFCLCLSLPHVFADASNAIADRDAQRALQRARKVAFHSGNTGTTFSEVSLVVLAGPVGMFIRRAVDVNKGVRVTFGGIVANDRGKPLDAVHVVGKDFLWCVLPVGAAMFHPLHVVPALVLLAIVSYAFAQHAVKTRSKRAPYPTPHVTDSAPAPMGAVSRVGASRPYLTTYRASMTIATSVAILAVDFAAFPRRLGKTHAHGVGLMDLGAGSFLFANALVSRRRGGRAEKDFFANQGATRAARRLAKRVAPLLALALARAVSVTSTDYHVPVGEYGKRWNFFATLAAVLVLVDVAPVPPGTSAAFGFAVLLAHQWALSSKRMWSILAGASYLTEFRKEVGGGEGNASPWAHETLGHWVLADPRGDSFVSQNKEGIFSLPGYVGLFFLGVGIGVWMETSLVNAGRDARKAVNAELESLVQKATRAREMALAAAQQAKEFPSGGEFRARASLKHKDATAAEAQAVTATKRHRSRQAVERFDNENLISVVTSAPGGRADPHETAEGGWVWAWRWLAKLVGTYGQTVMSVHLAQCQCVLSLPKSSPCFYTFKSRHTVLSLSW